VLDEGVNHRRLGWPKTDGVDGGNRVFHMKWRNIMLIVFFLYWKITKIK
jgi:hypothetical protein